MPWARNLTNGIEKKRCVGPSVLNPVEDRSLVLGTNYLQFEWFVPQNGTAVLKGLSGSSFYAFGTPPR